MSALDSSRCSNRECHITGYTVNVSLVDTEAVLQVEDPCNTLTSQRLLKQVLQNAYEQVVAANASVLTVEAAESACGEGSCDCTFGPHRLTYVFGEKKATFVPSATDGLDFEENDVDYEVTF